MLVEKTNRLQAYAWIGLLCDYYYYQQHTQHVISSSIHLVPVFVYRFESLLIRISPYSLHRVDWRRRGYRLDCRLSGLKWIISFPLVSIGCVRVKLMDEGEVVADVLAQLDKWPSTYKHTNTPHINPEPTTRPYYKKSSMHMLSWLKFSFLVLNHTLHAPTHPHFLANWISVVSIIRVHDLSIERLKHDLCEEERANLRVYSSYNRWQALNLVVT